MANRAKQMNTPPEASPAESIVHGGVVSEQAEIGDLTGKINWTRQLPVWVIFNLRLNIFKESQKVKN